MKKKFFSLLTALVMLVSIAPVVFAESAQDEAYLMYSDSSWTYQYWNDGTESPVVATNADVTGAGDYTVGLDFTGTDEGFATGIAFAAIGIVNGETTVPGYTIEMTSMKVNGEEIEYTKGYTSSDDGICTRMNILNEWVTELPVDARSFDGDTTDSSWNIVDKAAFEEVKTIEVSFTLHEGTPTVQVTDEAFLMYADSSWTYQYMNDGTESDVVATNATITGAGTYTVGLDFTGTADGAASGLAFSAVGIVNGESNFAGYCIAIKSIKVNGEDIEFTKGYTSSDDEICTRMNIFNEWVTELPADARSMDGDLTDSSWITVDKELFASVETVEVTFQYILPGSGPDTAYIMYSDIAWNYQYWGTPVESGVVATDAIVEEAGNYTVGLDFTGTPDGAATDIAFAALGIKTGEITHPGYLIKINSIKVNGEEIEFAKGYTSSDDGSETRMNIYNEWVTELPVDARSSEGDVTDSAWIIADKALFASVETIEINFDYIEGEVVAPVEEVFDYETALNADYNAYFGVQTTSYIFRNAWFDSYGIDTANWTHLTGWNESNEEVDYGGTFTDTAITGNGTYTVSAALGDMGFGTDEKFNMLFVSTDIPSQLVADGYVTITDVTTVMDGGKAQAYTFADLEEAYVRIAVLNSYNPDVGVETIGYTMPKESIDITFTISGLNKDAAAAEPTEKPVEETTAATTAAVTPAPDKESGEGLSGGVIAAIAGGAVLLIGGGAAAIVLTKKKKSKTE